MFLKCYDFSKYVKNTKYQSKGFLDLIICNRGRSPQTRLKDYGPKRCLILLDRMFDLSELYTSGDSASIHFFKPWWDLIIEYLNMGMFLLTLIAFANVTLVEGEGIICLGKEKTYSWPQVLHNRFSLSLIQPQ